MEYVCHWNHSYTSVDQIGLMLVGVFLLCKRAHVQVGAHKDSVNACKQARPDAHRTSVDMDNCSEPGSAAQASIEGRVRRLHDAVECDAGKPRECQTCCAKDFMCALASFGGPSPVSQYTVSSCAPRHMSDSLANRLALSHGSLPCPARCVSPA